MRIKISPSLLSADFAHLGAEAKKMERSGADWLHVDVMDGHFVPNITIGAPVVKSLRRETTLPLDIHLMIDDPGRFVDDFADAGADILTFHLEAVQDEREARGLLEDIKKRGVRPAVSIKPGTPAEKVFPLLDLASMVLIMTVEPGFGGQSLIESTLEKVTQLRAECDRRALPTDLEVDGGIQAGNIARAARAGANVFVAGSAIFGAPDPAAAIRALRAAAADIPS